MLWDFDQTFFKSFGINPVWLMMVWLMERRHIGDLFAWIGSTAELRAWIRRWTMPRAAEVVLSGQVTRANVTGDVIPTFSRNFSAVMLLAQRAGFPGVDRLVELPCGVVFVDRFRTPSNNLNTTSFQARFIADGRQVVRGFVHPDIDLHVEVNRKTGTGQGEDPGDRVSLSTTDVTFRLRSSVRSVAGLVEVVEEAVAQYRAHVDEDTNRGLYVFTYRGADAGRGGGGGIQRFCGGGGDDEAAGQGAFSEYPFRSAKTFDNTFFEGKDALVDRIDAFEAGADACRAVGVPHTLGMLLHGKDVGTGRARRSRPSPTAPAATWSGSP